MRRLGAIPWLFLSAAACGGPRSTPAAGPTSTAAAAAPHPLSVADIAARAMPAVVTIRTAQSLGTGFVVRADGWIATNLHVIVGGPRVRVTLRDDRELEAVEVLAASPEYDLALIRVEARGLHALRLGDSDTMRPGDPVVAIGNPLGLVDTVSDGLVSARRNINGFEVLQVSAPIAPGSSGGPLFNERGEVIGIATAVLQGGQNLNFGVPVRYLASLLRRPEPMPFAEFAAVLAELQREGASRAPTRGAARPSTGSVGCPSAAQRTAARVLADAVASASPLCDEGKSTACYHMYDGAASDALRKLPASCKALQRELSDAQRRAARRSDPGAQAAVLRDAFDAVLGAIDRRKHE